jgi:hypothetical protein
VRNGREIGRDTISRLTDAAPEELRQDGPARFGVLRALALAQRDDAVYVDGDDDDDDHAAEGV